MGMDEVLSKQVFIRKEMELECLEDGLKNYEPEETI